MEEGNFLHGINRQKRNEIGDVTFTQMEPPFGREIKEKDLLVFALYVIAKEIC